MQENQNPAAENAFGREWESIHRRLPLVASETRYRTQRVRRVGRESNGRSQSNTATTLLKIEEKKPRMHLERS
jgi:hypothetical protein